MTPLQTLFAHVRGSHSTAINSAELLMRAVVDHDEEYPRSTISELESAASKLELSARTLRSQIAVFNAANPLDE